MNCDPIARWYRWFEYLTFGAALTQRRQHYLQVCSTAKRVLILGDGDGRFTAALLAQNPLAAVDSVDLSREMLRLAARRVPSGSSVRLLHADALTVPLAGRYDLIVTHFFLDCLADFQVEQLVSRVALVSTGNVKWIVSDFQVPPAGVRRYAGTALIKALYYCFRLLTGLKTGHVPDYGAVFTRHGFRRNSYASAFFGILLSEWWERS
jgi:ubiquinone/menaquinone biosynthesis C-methylase UbiE